MLPGLAPAGAGNRAVAPGAGATSTAGPVVGGARDTHTRTGQLQEMWTMSSLPRIALNDGTTIPQIGFGTLNVPPDRQPTRANIEKTAQVVGLAFELGYRHVDTAQSY